MAAPIEMKEIETSKIDFNTKFPPTWKFIRWNNIPKEKMTEYMIQLFYRANTRSGCLFFKDKRYSEIVKLLEEGLFFIAIDDVHGIIGIISCQSLDDEKNLYNYGSQIFYVIYTNWSCSFTGSYDIELSETVITELKKVVSSDLHHIIDMQHQKYIDLQHDIGLLKATDKTIVIRVGKFIKIELLKWINKYVKKIPRVKVTNIMTLGWSVNDLENTNNGGILNSSRQLANLKNIKSNESIEEIIDFWYPEGDYKTKYIFWNIPTYDNMKELSAAEQKYLYYKNKYLNLKKLFIE
jgi:hypothetical protein